MHFGICSGAKIGLDPILQRAGFADVDDIVFSVPEEIDSRFGREAFKDDLEIPFLFFLHDSLSWVFLPLLSERIPFRLLSRPLVPALFFSVS